MSDPARPSGGLRELPAGARSLRRLGLVVFVVAFGLFTTVSSWGLLRQHESEVAELEVERVLLRGTTAIESELSAVGIELTSLAERLSAGSAMPGQADLDRVVAETGLLDRRSGLSGLSVVEFDFDAPTQMVLTATSSRDDGAEPVTIIEDSFDSMALVPAANALLRGRELTAVSVEDSGLFGSADAAAGSEPGVVLFVPLYSGSAESAPVGAETPVGMVAGRVRFADLTSSVGLAVTVDGLTEGAVAGDPPAGRGSAVFTVGDAVFVVDAAALGVETDRRLSSAVLAAGLVISLLGGWLSHRAWREAVGLGYQERADWVTSHDPLTDLPNRLGLTTALRRMLATCDPDRQVAVVFLDMDRLKLVNDSLGHGAGDELLAAIGRRLADLVRRDDIVGRFGGDEYVVLSQVESEEAAIGMTERLLDGVRRPVALEGKATQAVTASAGVALSEPGGVSGLDTEGLPPGFDVVQDLLRDADLAMHRAKDAGGDQWSMFDAELRADALAALEIEQELRRAIRTGQLVVHYQPIVDTESAQVDRFEALVRWEHPTRGMIPPGQFLGVASQSGLIVDLGEHVLREACRQVAMWSAARGGPVHVSVNLAERQLLDPSLVATVRRIIRETGVDPAQVELELTEDLIVDRLDGYFEVLQELANMGIKLAIDDFGTSRASLGQLKKLAMVDTLKIDRSFVTEVANDSVDRKIITAIVALAHSVGMEVVVEGVEYADQVAALRGLGVTLIQGYYFQRPGPPEKAVALLAKTFDVPEPDILETV